MVIKMKIRIVALALCAAALFSCTKEMEQQAEITGDGTVPEGYTLQEFTAVCEETESKTALSGSNTVWGTGDQIKVVLSDGTAVNATLTAGAGTKQGEFRGLVPNGKTAKYAVYPASAYSSVSSSTVKVAIPSSQTGSFAASNIAVAKVDAASHNMSFKNVNAFLVFQLKSGTDVTRVEVTSVGGGNLAATVPVSCSGTPTPGNAFSGTLSSTVSMTTSGGGIYYILRSGTVRRAASSTIRVLPRTPARRSMTRIRMTIPPISPRPRTRIFPPVTVSSAAALSASRISMDATIVTMTVRDVRFSRIRLGKKATGRTRITNRKNDGVFCVSTIPVQAGIFYVRK